MARSTWLISAVGADDAAAVVDIVLSVWMEK